MAGSDGAVAVLHLVRDRALLFCDRRGVWEDSRDVTAFGERTINRNATDRAEITKLGLDLRRIEICAFAA